MKTLRRLIQSLHLWLAVWRWRREWARQVAMPWPILPDGALGSLWQNDDAATLRAWFATPTGLRLVQALQRMEYDTAISAALRAQPQGRDYAAGYAAGSRCMAAYIMTLSAARPEAEQTADDADQGEASLRARYAP